MEYKFNHLESSWRTVAVLIFPEEYQSDLQRGLTEDETLAPGRHLFRRGGFLIRHPSADITTSTINEVPASSAQSPNL